MRKSQTRPGSAKGPRRAIPLPTPVRSETDAEVRLMDDPPAVTPFLRALMRAGRPEFLVELRRTRQAAGY